MKLLRLLAILLFLLPACSKQTNPTTKIVKPKYHHRWYDRKKDKRTNRTKMVRFTEHPIAIKKAVC